MKLLVQIQGVCVSPSVVSDSDPMDCSPPVSSVGGILQARILKWVAIPFLLRSVGDPRSIWKLLGSLLGLDVSKDPHLHDMKSRPESLGLASCVMV